MRVLILMLCLVAGQVWAIDDAGRFRIKGYAASSCGSVVEEYRTKWNAYKEGYGESISGYINAYNYLKLGKPDWAEDTDTDSRLLFVVNYCKEHPLDSFMDGIHALMRQFDPDFRSNTF